MDKTYLGLREQAFALQHDKSINVHLENDKQVYAALVDIPVRSNIATLFCVIDGTVSLYYSTGRIDVGLGEKPAIRKAAMSLLVSSGQCLPYMQQCENHETDNSVMQFFAFCRDGLKTKRIDLESKEKEDKFLNFLVQNVITAVRAN